MAAIDELFFLMGELKEEGIQDLKSLEAKILQTEGQLRKMRALRPLFEGGPKKRARRSTGKKGKKKDGNGNDESAGAGQPDSGE